jgi:hypothetical protein
VYSDLPGWPGSKAAFSRSEEDVDVGEILSALGNSTATMDLPERVTLAANPPQVQR